jgi:hypothetical protein
MSIVQEPHARLFGLALEYTTGESQEQLTLRRPVLERLI